MSNIVVFVPKSAVDAATNLRAFVSLARNSLTTFGENLAFDEDVWDLTPYIYMKGSNSKVRANFTAFDDNLVVASEPLASPFLSFAKAYIRYQYSLKPSKQLVRHLDALRTLEYALRTTYAEVDPALCDAHVFNRAAAVARARLMPSTAYRVGAALAAVADFMWTKRLVRTPLQWINPIPRMSDTVKVGPEFETEREAKLPSRAALEALPHIFLAATEPSDMLTISVLLILLSAPDRISEVLLLSRNPGHETVDRSIEKVRYGLRWFPAKGAPPMIKWLIPNLVEPVKKALTYLHDLTSHAQEICLWYEAHPTSIYLHAEVAHFRGRRFLTSIEVSQLLFGGVGNERQGKSWLQNRCINFQRKGSGLALFSDVERTVLSMLPTRFPVLDSDRGLNFSEGLMVVERNALSAKPTYRCMIEAISHSHINSRIGKRSAGVRSIFHRHGQVEEDGSPIAIRTHQFRHYLNTLAAKGGMSEVDIALWSGRKDVRQNAAYQHISDDENVARIRAAVGDSQRMIGPLATVPLTSLISRSEFAILRVPTAHTTTYGYCIHDYVQSPCSLHLDCLSCQELICVKGDAGKASQIKAQRDETAALLLKAETDGKDHYGAGRWYDHHKQALERLDQLCALLEDPTIEEGAFISLSSKAETRVIRRTRRIAATNPLKE